MTLISSFEIIKLVVLEPCIFVWIPESIAEAAAVIHNGAKVGFANGTATFINRTAILLNNAPKNSPDWIYLNIWVLKNFISVDILSSNAFPSIVFFVLLLIIIHETNFFL